MLFVLFFGFSFIFFFKSFSFKLPPPMKSEWRLLLLSPLFWEQFVSFFMSLFHKEKLAIGVYQVPLKMPLKKMNLGIKEPETIEADKISLLDLPELTLDCILERLSPSGLCKMAGVCSSLRDKCTSDYLWKKHLNQKWGRVIGDAAYREWRCHIASTKRPNLVDQSNPKGLLGSLTTVWPFSWIKPKFETIKNNPKTSLPVDSIMALYLSLERGNFWFPAQVYNRENGHVGFLLSCYDAKISYDYRTDTFQARYSPYGRRMIEESIHWDRLRPPPVNTPANDLHISDCLNDLKPGDHVEIQWRRSREFPYGWWYAIVGHMDQCGWNQNLCHCQYDDMVILEFNQYPLGSRWRRTIVNRQEHREEGNEADGFYGGIRKLHKPEEISTWKSHWPTQVFE